MQFEDVIGVTGNVDLDIDKVVEIINYLAQKVPNLSKVKLLKMLWSCDYLHYKREDKSITGLVYSALPMGPIPEGYEILLLIEGVEYDEVQYDEYIGYKFKTKQGFQIEKLSEAEIHVIDEVIHRYKNINTVQIVNKIYEEEAYKNTPINRPISYEFAKRLLI